MNTADLQLEGVYLALAALTNALREKGLLDTGEIERSLASAETCATDGLRRRGELSPANKKAVLFPIRYLRLANEVQAAGGTPDFRELTKRIGQAKDDAAGM